MTTSLFHRLRALRSSGLATNTLWNFAGVVLPLLAAVVSIPLIIEHLGVSRFGVLTLSWAAVGYFSIFDLGLGRAVTQRVAMALGAGQSRAIPALVWTALLMMAALGLLGSVVIWHLVPWITEGLLNIPAPLLEETQDSFFLLALTIPIVILCAGLRGVLEAYQLFRVVNLVRIPLGVFNYLAPLLVLPFSNSVLPIVGVLVFSRCVACLVYLCLCLQRVDGLSTNVVAGRAQARSLLDFGAWMTLSNIIGPVMVYMDRFAIAGFVSMAAVAYYATPQEMITRLGFIPGAVMGVLFPTLAAAFSSDRHSIHLFFERAARYLLILTFPIVMTATVFAYEILDFWIGADFAANSALIMQILLLGVFVNTQARLLNTLIQSEGRADISAKVHLLEFVAYTVALFLVIPRYGAVGAAVVWSGRTLIDLLLFAVIMRLRLVLDAGAVRRMLLWLLLLSMLLWLGASIDDLALKVVYFLAMLGGYGLGTWRVLNDDLPEANAGRPGGQLP